MARYNKQVLGYKKKKNIEAINSFMAENYLFYNPVSWYITVEKYVNHSGKYPLCQCSGVYITQNEVDIIDGIGDRILSRLLFTLVCLAKFYNFRNPKNNNWIDLSDNEIFEMACITTTSLDKDYTLYKLYEQGFIDFTERVDDLKIKVDIIKADDNSKNVLFINDFRKLGYEWLLYKGERFIRCAKCGVLFRKTAKMSNNRNRCNDCLRNAQDKIHTFICIDCGREIEITDGNLKNRKRCDECGRKHKQKCNTEYKRQKRRRQKINKI